MKITRNRRGIGSALIAVSLLCTGSVALAEDAAKLEDSVVFAMPGGPVQDVLQKCTFDDFTKKFNVRVDVLSIQPQATLARVLAQKNNESIDVTWSLAATDYQGYKAGVFMPVTPEQVPNLANIDPKFLPEPHSGALLTTAIQGIEYNTKIFAEKGWDPPKSWRDLWDPKYVGHIGINDLSVTSGQGLLAVAGFLNGGDAKNFDAGFDAIAKLKPNLYTIFSCQLDVEQGGAVVLASRRLRSDCEGCRSSRRHGPLCHNQAKHHPGGLGPDAREAAGAAQALE